MDIELCKHIAYSITKEVTSMEFSRTVRLRMAELRMTGSKLAKKTGYSAKHISDLLAGRRRWNETTIDRVCKILGIRVQFAIPVTSQHDEAFQPCGNSPDKK